MKKVILYTFILLLSTNSKVFSQQIESIETILEKSMKAAEIYSQVVEEYDAEVYMRIYVQTLKKNFLYRYTHLIPDFILYNKNGDEGVIEALSNLKFNHPITNGQIELTTKVSKELAEIFEIKKISS